MPEDNVPVVLPSLGESVTEATIVEWLKQPGEAVALDEEIVEVTSDKADLRIPSPATGVLARIIAQPGDTIEVGQILCELSANGVPAATDDAHPPATAPAPLAADAEIAEILLPSLGESVTEATIVEWLKQPGEAVALDEEIVEITSDKADLRVPSPVAGALTEHVAQPGDTVEVGGLLARIAVGAVGATTGTSPAAAAAAAAAPERTAAAVGGGFATPLARRIAGAQGVDLARVTGSGSRGRIQAADVAGASNGAGGVSPAEDAVQLKGPPAMLAKYMNESRAIPTATTFRTIPVGTLDTRRRQINQTLAAASRKEKLSFTHLVAWAIVKSVERFPIMSTGFEEIDGKPHKLVRGNVDIGLAVDVERRDGSRSLLVPVVRAAETLGFRGFVDAYDDLVKRTRSGKVSPDELRGATVSLTNPGGFGTVASVPRLMPGQGTIVATGSIALPVGFEHVDATALGIQKVMTATSTYDHRVIQGAESGAFLRQIDLFLAGEDGFYEEVAQSLQITLPALVEPQPLVIAPPGAATTGPAQAGPADYRTLQAVSAAMSLVKAHRIYGHMAADLDPLGYPPVGDPALEPASLELTDAMMALAPADLLRVFIPGQTFADVFPRMRETYCGTIAYQVEHISSHEQRRWLRREIESGFIRVVMPLDERIKLLERLVNVDVFERFLQRAYIGQKTFSIEGVDALVPMLDEIIELCAESGANQIVIGMAHRGRLNIITHVVGRPIESILGEFEGMTESAGDEDWIETAGDVKYHLGAEGSYVTLSGRPVTITLAANPSHLEQVNAVVEGATRARQTARQGRDAHHDPSLAVPVLVHGDAAFPGQGVVAETLNLSGLAGFTTGGTIHIIANNQIGFTTDPQDSRSTRYASDLAKGFDIPIIHVNGDDVEACISAIRLAVAFRNKFQRDILVDLVGYRRHGHNETDEPAYTQPVMSQTIKNHPRPYQVYAAHLVAEGVVTDVQVGELEAQANEKMSQARTAVAAMVAQNDADSAPSPPVRVKRAEVTTAVPNDLLHNLNEELLAVPDGFTVHPKLVPQLERRREAMGAGGGILWAHAEALAMASLLVDGVPVRLTGQDSERGTFSQRHLRLHDAAEEGWMPFTGKTHTPMRNLENATASFEVFNSPLSEAATIGFEYGYSTLAPETLVLWEAQYGDFANGGQMMVDQFIASGRAKWGERSRLVMLLPHGYEGNGPEHSSARIERFLQACAEDNMRVANPSTADNYFHLLRRQGLWSELRPLIVFTPKSLLRSREASCRVEDLATGGFQVLIDDPRAAERRATVTRLLLCSGKVYYDLDGHEAREAATDVAIARLELLYPLPEDRLKEVFASYPNLTEVTWVQEEPRNMGAWTFVPRRLERILPADVTLYYVGRSARSSPAEGYPKAHKTEQHRIVQEAFSPGADRVIP